MKLMYFLLHVNNKMGCIGRVIPYFLFVYILVSFLFTGNIVVAQTGTPTLLTPSNCNTPLVGPGRVINRIGGGLTTVLSGFSDLNNLTDGNLANAASFNTVAGLNLITRAPIVSVKDVQHYYPSGTIVGFVFEPPAGLASATLLGGFSINLRKDNGVITNLAADKLLTLNVLGTSGGQKRISFTSTVDFDEVELVVNSGVGLSVASTLKVYYAFVEPAVGCRFDCPILNTVSLPVTTVSGNNSVGVATFSVNGLNNLTDADLSNYTTMNLTAVALGEAAGYVGVKFGTAYSSGTYAGFVFDESLLSVGLFNSSVIEIYQNGTFKESKSLTDNLIDVGILGNQRMIGFKTNNGFDEIRFKTSSSILSLRQIKVYYAFAQIDTDGDGFPDCVDKCPTGNDNLDADGDGIPDACDCMLDAGPDITLCGDASTYAFGNLGTGLTWSLISQPQGANASVSNGNVSGMTLPGVYTIQVSNSSINGCTDVVNIRKNELIGTSCNNPIIGSGIEVFDPSGGLCLLCLFTGTYGASNLVDNDPDNYMDASGVLSLLDINRPIVGVKNKSMIYPARTRTGFVIKSSTGLIDASVLSNLVIKTYKNGIFQEASSPSGQVLTADVIGTGGNAKQRIGFVTTQDFDAVALYSNSLLGVLTDLHIYYAFQEPENCTKSEADADCIQMLTADGPYKAELKLNDTAGLLSVISTISNLGNIINSNTSDYASINQLVGIVNPVSIAVKTSSVIQAGKYQAGFIIAKPTGGLDLSALSGTVIQTRLNGGGWTNYPVSAGLIDLTLLGGTNSPVMLKFTPVADFNEIQLTMASLLVAANTVRIYGAFVSPDSDGDGIPDCIDPCCSGPSGDCNAIAVISDASCVNCDVKVDIVVSGTIASQYSSYALFEGTNQRGSTINSSSGSFIFKPASSGFITYTIKASSDGLNYIKLKDIVVNVHPAAATWKTAAGSSVWQSADNWTENTSGGSGGYPIWCTDVTIPGNATTNYPLLLPGDACRDIYFQYNASVGQIPQLKYRYAYVDFNPGRNRWYMLSAPLRYMYSADYHGDISWTGDNAISPKIYMRYFDLDYAANTKPNPDGVLGVSTGNFSKAFAELEEKLDAASGFVLWVNGSNANGKNYPDTNFPTGTPYQFPRRTAGFDETTGDHDVQYDYHTTDGRWYGTPFNLTRGGNDRKGVFNTAWTSVTEPEKDNRYRFIYEEKPIGANKEFEVSVRTGRTEIIGNPFMSHLDFTSFYATNTGKIRNYFRVWDGNQFYTYDGDIEPSAGLAEPYIAPMQSFLIETQGSAGSNVSLTFTPAASLSRVGSSSRLKSSPAASDVLKISVSSGGNTGYTVLTASEGYSDNYLPEEDIFKLFSPLTTVPEIYTVVGQMALEINKISTASGSHLIPLGIRSSQTGSMEIGVTGADSFGAYSEVLLVDAENNKTYDLRKEPVLSFVKSSTENLEGRFYIALKEGTIAGSIQTDEPLASRISVMTSESRITVSSPEDKILGIYLYDVSGILQYQLQHLENHYQTMDTPVKSGIYVLKVQTSKNMTNFKLVLRTSR